MARLFRAGTHAALRKQLSNKIRPDQLAQIGSEREYDRWIERTVELDCWAPYSRNGLAADRWGYFAKLINIIVYEVVSNRELFTGAAWRRLSRFLHLPIDSSVVEYLSSLDRTFPCVTQLKGMTKDQYFEVQVAARRLAAVHQCLPIWFEDAWANGGSPNRPLERTGRRSGTQLRAPRAAGRSTARC